MEGPEAERMEQGPSPDLPLLIGLFGVEFALVAFSLVLNRKGERPLGPFLGSAAGVLALVALIGGGIAVAVVLFRLRVCRPGRCWLTLGLNLASIVGTCATAELAVRVLTVRTWAGPMFAGTALLPRDWRDVAARNRMLLGQAALHGSYFVFDEELGWTVGRSRRDASGLYLSSAEGLRSPRAGMSLAGPPARPRVALVGDSYTFGLEVPWEDSWAAQLQKELGEDAQVLNFGVDGYGVDQAYLRYQRDARPWRPDVVVFGLVDHDFERTMGVYAFLTFPQSQLPFAKPRFVATGAGLEVRNVPVPTPSAIFAAPSVADLPFIEYDRHYHPLDWEWRFFDASYATRFLRSRFPRWTALGPLVSDSQLETVNRQLLRAFVELAEREGSLPLLAYFPGPSRLQGGSPPAEGSPAQRIARSAGLPFVDVTGCLLEVPAPERLVVLHYSRSGSAAVVKCLLEPVRQRLREAGRGPQPGRGEP